MTNDQIREIFGWYGVGAIILAYTLVSFSIIETTNMWYQVLNGTGAICVAVDAYYDKNYQPAVLNIVWTLIALVALLKMFVL
jgi:hypothetical protein